MKAIIEVDVPDFQIGQEVSIYFKDTMMIKGVVQEPKTGHWIYDDECKEHGHCDICGFKTDLVDGNPHNYCRSCGARMENKHETDN